MRLTSGLALLAAGCGQTVVVFPQQDVAQVGAGGQGGLGRAEGQGREELRVAGGARVARQHEVVTRVQVP